MTNFARVLIIASLLSVALTSWAQTKTSGLPPSGPFVGIDIAKLTPARQAVIVQAATDFERVKNGLKPTCKAEADSGFSDGGTLIYECKHYRLTVMKGIFSLQGVYGFLYGPIITFSEDESVSDVRFYTPEELSKLLKHR